MLNIIRYQDLGTYQNFWLDAHYHFSFSNYRNAERMGFGVLRVINDDIVRAGMGFDMHPHRDMEIITYVRKGAITHRDNTGNEGVTRAGEVQVMSAGSGIIHSEHNEEAEDTNLYQIWIEPREQGVTPRWDMRRFPKEMCDDGLQLLVSGKAEHQNDNVLAIHQDAAIYGGRLQKGGRITHMLEGQGYLLVSEGEIMVDGHMLNKGDGAEITGQESVAIEATSESEVLLIEVPA